MAPRKLFRSKYNCKQLVFGFSLFFLKSDCNLFYMSFYRQRSQILDYLVQWDQGVITTKLVKAVAGP